MMRHPHARLVVDHAPDVSWSHQTSQAFALWWESKPDSRLLPARANLDALGPTDILATAVLLDVQRQPLRVRYTLIGSKLMASDERDLTGEWVDAAHPHVFERSPLFAHCREVVETGRPTRDKVLLELWALPPACHSTEYLLLPLAGDGVAVDTLMLVCTFFDTNDTLLG